MQVSYKRDLNNNYLIVKAEKEIDTESYQVRLLTGNHVEGLLPCMTQSVDGQNLLYYEITGKQSFANIYECQKIKRENLQLLFDCIIKRIEVMRGYLLGAGGLLLNPEYIYLDSSRKEILFCYFPVKEKEVLVSLRELMEYLLPQIDHTDQEAVILGYNIYRRIMADDVCLDQIKQEVYKENIVSVPPESVNLWEEEAFVVEDSSEDLMKSILEEKEDVVHPAVATIAVAIAGLLLFIYFYFINNTEFSWHVYVAAAVILLMTAGVSAVLYLLKMKRSKREIRQEPLEKFKHIEEDIDFQVEVTRPQKQNQQYEGRAEEALVKGEETVILKDPELEKMPCLTGVYPPMLQPILVKKDVFILGKLESVVDAVLPSFAVSRIHAKITKEDDYYISDLNSLNGTYINHKIISGEDRHRLEDGDEIAFGDLIYSFSIGGIK